MPRRFLTARELLLACLVGACGAEPDAAGTLGSAIADGTTSGPGDDAVVYVRSPGGGCAGVLVAPNLMLTTQHCVAAHFQQTFTCTADGELENGGSGAGEIGEIHLPEEIEIHVGPAPTGTEPAAFGEHVLGTGTTVICRNDLAFVVLDRALDALPTLSLRLNRPVRAGESVTLIGYGASNEAGVRQRRRREGVPIVSAGIPPRTFAIGPGVCLGDSGGPAVSSETGAVLGVLSMIHDLCGAELSGGVYTNVSEFETLSRDAFRLAGAEPWLEGDAPPGAGAPDPNPGYDAGCSLAVPRTPANCSAIVLVLMLAGMSLAKRTRRYWQPHRWYTL